MMPNLAGLSQVTTGATALANLIMVSPQAPGEILPQTPFNLNGPPMPAPAFLFDFEGDQSITLKSDIPDHYIETNSAIQDQIANHPEIFTTGGFISELNDIPPDFLKILKTIADKAQVLGAYLPQVSTTAQIVYAQANFLYRVAENAANAAISAWSSITGADELNPPQNKQQRAFQKLYGYWSRKYLFTVTTPWMQIRDMAIQDFKVTSDEDTRVISNFTVTFKKLRFASTSFVLGVDGVAGSAAGVTSAYAQYQGQAAAQASPMVNQGATVPSSSTSFLSKFGLG